jgi:hypothetical protein
LTGSRSRRPGDGMGMTGSGLVTVDSRRIDSPTRVYTKEK